MAEVNPDMYARVFEDHHEGRLIFEDLVKHPLTDLGLDAFLKDWAKLPPGGDPFKASAAPARAAAR